jgi:formamidopyrimidine-DNA glycosylase
LSYLEAKADGIRIEAQNRQTMYYPRCQFCGQEVRSFSYLRRNRYTCPACRPYKALFQKLKLRF